MAFQLLPAIIVVVASLLHVATATGNEISSNTSCAPATCGNLTIRYPFSLDGVQPLYCGYPVFNLTCDSGTGHAFLGRTTFGDPLYRVDDISYENSSLVVAVETAFAGDAGCPVPDFNVSSSLAPYPLIVSNTNKYLVVVYNCTLPDDTRLQRPCANQTTMGAYISDRWNSTPPSGIPGNCISVSVPVRGGMKLLDQHYEQLIADTFGDGRTAINGNGSVGGTRPANQQYERLISDGFVLEWQRPITGDPDCDACRRNGGGCRFQQLMFQCVSCHGLICSSSTSPYRSHRKLTVRAILIGMSFVGE